jgi:hypothetical protein
MHPLLFKLLLLIPLIALLGILTFKKINECFDNLDDSTITTTMPVTTTAPQTTIPAELISTQLTTGIASSLGVSVRRITNLNYTGDIGTQTLAVSFTVLDPNLIETSKNELAATAAANYANVLFAQGNFIVPINKINVRLTKLNQNSNVSNASNGSTAIGTSIPIMDPASYFNNKGLLDTANYAKQVYDTVPVDSAATRFFTLQPDSNFNLMPVMPTSTN